MNSLVLMTQKLKGVS